MSKRMPQGGKRLAMQKSDWLSDWFISYSPRNDNSFAEGQWGQWVSMALQILQHPATEIVRPDARAAVKDLDPGHFYDEVNRTLSDGELDELFGGAS